MVQYYDYIWGYKLTNIPLQKMSQDIKIQEINFIALWLYIYDSYAALMP